MVNRRRNLSCVLLLILLILLIATPAFCAGIFASRLPIVAALLDSPTPGPTNTPLITPTPTLTNTPTLLPTIILSSGVYRQPIEVQTQTALDLAELHTALDNRISQWQSQTGFNMETYIPPADAGFANDNNVKDVVYGKCGSNFFTFVVDKDIPDNANGATASGYAYTPSSAPSICHPRQYIVTDWEDDGGGWYFVYLK